MPFVQTIDGARANRVGREGVADADLAAMLARTADALAWLRERHRDGGLPLLRLPAAKDDVTPVLRAADSGL